ncbi:hypothetical protein JY96_21515 [Aquabacterium sp. NJ1]|nr:hypothetical protein JY96_21515 [Aquabacterium sp. NJ1]
MVLQHLVSLSEAIDDPDQLRELHNSGLTPEVIDRLRQLSAAEMAQLSKMKSRDVVLTLNPDGLLFNLRQLEATREERAKFQYFIRHGASPSMIMRLFRGTSHVHVRQQRAVMGITSTWGRPPVPKSERERRDIEEAWVALSKDMPKSNTHWERERFLMLHKRYGHYSLASLDAVIMTFRTQTGHAE